MEKVICEETMSFTRTKDKLMIILYEYDESN